jgi:hypothetical protein
MRELSLVLPHDVWLTSLDASASSESGSESSGGGGSVAAPSLQLSGCAAGHEAVAGFVTALKEIDGVTRVQVQSSELGGRKAGAGSTSGGDSDSSDSAAGGCQTRSFIAQFSMTVAFDAAPLPMVDSASSAPISATEESEAAAEEVSGEKEESEGG